MPCCAVLRGVWRGARCVGQVTDTTTFTSEKRREKEDFWLYETCKRCLQHLIDVFVMVSEPQLLHASPGTAHSAARSSAPIGWLLPPRLSACPPPRLQFYDETHDLLAQLLQLLSSFINRTHQSLAAGGVDALTHLAHRAAARLDADAWLQLASFYLAVAQETAPSVLELVTPPAGRGGGGGGGGGGNAALHRPSMPPAAAGAPPGTPTAGSGGSLTGASGYSLREGIGARRLGRFRTQCAVQLLLVQSLAGVCERQLPRVPPAALRVLLDALDAVCAHARRVDADVAARRRLAMQQAEDRVGDDRVVYDPPLLRLETEAAHAYLAALLHAMGAAAAVGRDNDGDGDGDGAQEEGGDGGGDLARRVVRLVLATLDRFAQGADPSRSVQPDLGYMAEARAKQRQLQDKEKADRAAQERQERERQQQQQQRDGDGGGGGGGGDYHLLANGAQRAAGALLSNITFGGGAAAKTAEAQRRAAAYAAAVAAATQGRTADHKSVIVGRTAGGLLVLMASPAVEFAPFAPLIHAALGALGALDDATFRAHLAEFFPLMTAVIGADYAPVEVLRAVAELFGRRVGPILGVAGGAGGGGAAAAQAVAAAAAAAAERPLQAQR